MYSYILSRLFRTGVGWGALLFTTPPRWPARVQVNSAGTGGIYGIAWHTPRWAYIQRERRRQRHARTMTTIRQTHICTLHGAPCARARKSAGSCAMRAWRTGEARAPLNTMEGWQASAQSSGTYADHRWGRRPDARISRGLPSFQRRHIAAVVGRWGQGGKRGVSSPAGIRPGARQWSASRRRRFAHGSSSAQKRVSLMVYIITHFRTGVFQSWATKTMVSGTGTGRWWQVAGSRQVQVAGIYSRYSIAKENII